jgi:hypothetical protein
MAKNIFALAESLFLSFNYSYPYIDSDVVPSCNDMSNEELNQRNYLSSGKLKGDKFGDFEELNIGGTSIRELKAVGIDIIIPTKIDYPFTLYKALKNPGSAKPDRVFLRRQSIPCHQDQFLPNVL